ncbi:hypothetical protein ZWY2020_040320 [Hordeum vulgare]|nr:hypothetical protein ZWY2020_040320 [Hordeum vulgare]
MAHNPTAVCSSIQPHPSLRSSCTMSPILVVIDAVDTTSLFLYQSPPPIAPLLKHPSLPRRRLHEGYDAQDAVAAQSSLHFGLPFGRCSEVDRRDLGFASTKGNDVERCPRCRGGSADQSFLRSPSYTNKPSSSPDPAPSQEPKPT